MGKGLNPYSGGKCIPMELALATCEVVRVVSILIQVVNVFLSIMQWHSYATRIGRSLNPYSGGKCIPIIYQELIRKETGDCLNPYSGGKCIPILHSRARGMQTDCLNPYSGGKCIPMKQKIYLLCQI